MVRRRQAGGSADVGELLASLKEPLESKEFRVRVTDPDHAPVGAKVRWRRDACCDDGGCQGEVRVGGALRGHSGA